MRIPLASCLLSCVLAVDLFYLSSLPSFFFDFDVDIVCFVVLSFSSGFYAVSSVSVSAAPRLAFRPTLIVPENRKQNRLSLCGVETHTRLWLLSFCSTEAEKTCF